MPDDAVLPSEGRDFPLLRAAHLISDAARDAALAWAQPLPTTTVLDVAWDLHRTFYYLGITLQRLARLPQNPEPGEPPHTGLKEPGGHIYGAGSAIVTAGLALRDNEVLQVVSHDVADGLTARSDPGEGQAAMASAQELADATTSAYRIVDRTSADTTTDRNTAIGAFMSVLDSLDTAAETLALQVSCPYSAIFTAARTLLEQACTQLQEAVVCSAIDFRQPDSGKQVVTVRQQYPVLPHRSRPGLNVQFSHAARLAYTSFPPDSVPQASAPRPTSRDPRQPRQADTSRRIT